MAELADVRALPIHRALGSCAKLALYFENETIFYLLVCLFSWTILLLCFLCLAVDYDYRDGKGDGDGDGDGDGRVDPGHGMDGPMRLGKETSESEFPRETRGLLIPIARLVGMKYRGANSAKARHRQRWSIQALA